MPYSNFKPIYSPSLSTSFLFGFVKYDQTKNNIILAIIIILLVLIINKILKDFISKLNFNLKLFTYLRISETFRKNNTVSDEFEIPTKDIKVKINNDIFSNRKSVLENIDKYLKDSIGIWQDSVHSKIISQHTNDMIWLKNSLENNQFSKKFLEYENEEPNSYVYFMKSGTNSLSGNHGNALTKTLIFIKNYFKFYDFLPSPDQFNYTLKITKKDLPDGFTFPTNEFRLYALKNIQDEFIKKLQDFDKKESNSFQITITFVNGNKEDEFIGLSFKVNGKPLKFKFNELFAFVIEKKIIGNSQLKLHENRFENVRLFFEFIHNNFPKEKSNPLFESALNIALTSGNLDDIIKKLEKEPKNLLNQKNEAIDALTKAMNLELFPKNLNTLTLIKIMFVAYIIRGLTFKATLTLLIILLFNIIFDIGKNYQSILFFTFLITGSLWIRPKLAKLWKNVFNAEKWLLIIAGDRYDTLPEKIHE